ncbi:unnamed protein product [Effrenium voratum]|uniref:Uncharacterized protein n=1 Tax=Effrenium voratum TaxID=2562239 RepID=A0AA36NI11_9DINO|nr:unnamed protein product [Effrenium voratum]
MLDKDKFDQSVDGWVDLGLPAPFHMRPLKGMNESTNFGIQSSLMGDVVTISLNTATLQLAGSNSLKPVATRHLKKYLISGASEYVKDAGQQGMGLPAPFHMRPLKGMNESTNFGIQSSLMGDVVTISLNTATLQLAGSNSLKPVATRHLKKYLISGASEYVKDAGGAARLE